MAMLGSARMVIWFEVDTPEIVPEHEDWHVHEHMYERLAIPGFLRDLWFRANEPGTYRGQCPELCGKEHAFMPIVVRAVSPEDLFPGADLEDDRVLNVARLLQSLDGDGNPGITVTVLHPFARPSLW